MRPFLHRYCARRIGVAVLAVADGTGRWGDCPPSQKKAAYTRRQTLNPTEEPKNGSNRGPAEGASDQARSAPPLARPRQPSAGPHGPDVADAEGVCRGRRERDALPPERGAHVHRPPG